MHDSKRLFRIFALALLLVSVAAMSAIAEQGEIKGWFKAGNDPGGYSIGRVKAAGGLAAYIKSEDPEADKFGTLMQSFSPNKYKGKRVRLSARVKSVGIKEWAGMWMRVDANKKSVAFDNMMDRPITGTSDWQEYSIVLDVPVQSDGIFIGLILHGEGEAYWDDVKFETVGLDVPLTRSGCGSASRRPEPKNLDFEN